MRSGADSDDGWQGDDNGEQGDDWDLDPDVDVADDGAYWRRRFLILAAGVVAVGVCAWLLPGAHSATSGPSAASSASRAALARSQTLPSAAYGNAWAGPAPAVSAALTAQPKSAATVTLGPAATPTQSLRQSLTPSPPSIGTAYRPGGSASPTASLKPGKTANCAPADIVLSLFTSQPGYAHAAKPRFSVYAVSTAMTPCTLPYGPAVVHVVVTRDGRVVWDSAACKIAGKPAVRFTLGVPQVMSVTWDRLAARPAGCAGSLPAGATGTFDAVALGAAGQTSPVRTFKLTKLAAEGRLQRVPHDLHLGNRHA